MVRAFLIGVTAFRVMLHDQEKTTWPQVRNSSHVSAPPRSQRPESRAKRQTNDGKYQHPRMLPCTTDETGGTPHWQEPREKKGRAAPPVDGRPIQPIMDCGAKKRSGEFHHRWTSVTALRLPVGCLVRLLPLRGDIRPARLPSANPADHA